jgi:lipopolysaccharide transport system ATP-binding protein
MAIHFRGVTHPPLNSITIGAPDSAIIGIIGLKGSGKAALLHLAAGLDTPVSGTVEGPSNRRLIQLGEPLNFAPVDVLALDSALSCQDALARESACLGLARLRRLGATILFASHDQQLLTRLCDEIWWLDHGSLAAKGDSRSVFPEYNRFVNEQLVAACHSVGEPLDLSHRRGGGRAEIVSLETIGPDGQPSLVLRSRKPAVIRVAIQFTQPVDQPVVGVMIRTRVGLEVYGTNTDLEQVRLGPCAAGDRLGLRFQFECNLCPGEYTLTAAIHDPDGTAHDWLDDAVAFSVAADRYTAGVADLHSTISID